MTTPNPPGVKMDKQTTLRLTSTSSYVEEDISSLLSDGEKKKSNGIFLRKLQWRATSSTVSSPLSRMLGAAAARGVRDDGDKDTIHRGGVQNEIKDEGVNLVRLSSYDATVASQRSSYTRNSQGTSGSSRTLRHSNRGVRSELSVTSSVNSRLPPLGRLRKHAPANHEDYSIKEDQQHLQDNGNSITISKNYEFDEQLTSQAGDNSPSKRGNVKSDPNDSPTSVILGEDDVFHGVQSFDSETTPGHAANISNCNPTSVSTPKRPSLTKRGVTLSTIKSGKTMETYIECPDTRESQEDKHTADYRNAMDRMRKLMTGVAEKETVLEEEAEEADINSSSSNNSKGNSNDLGSSSDLASSESNHKNHSPAKSVKQTDDESTPPGPIDVDTLTRHVTAMERRNLRAMHKLGYHHLRNNQINHALDVFMEILRGQRERHGKTSLEVAMAMHNLGVVCVKGGRFEEGTRLCDGAARLRAEKLGKDHLDVAVSLAQQGVALMEMQEYPLALASFREALRIRRKAFGPKHPLVIRLLNNIGCALFEMDDLAEARNAFDEALVVQRDLMRETSLEAKTSCNDSLMDCSTETDVELQDKNLEVDPKETHNMLLSIALTLCNLGSIHLRWGKYDDSLVYYEDALLIQESVLGEHHKVVLNTKESMDFVIQSREENHQTLLENHADTALFPSILSMDGLTNLILPRYETGKKIYDKVSNEIASLLDSASPSENGGTEGDTRQFACTSNSQDEMYIMQPFACGQPLTCAEQK